MNEENKLNENTDEVTSNDSGLPIDAPAEESNPKRKLIIGSGVAILLLIAFVIIWSVSTRETGKPVPAPRDISFSELTPGEQSSLAADQKVELSDEQLKAANLKLITVGEGFDKTPGAANSTGVVQPNDYKETPVMSLVGGVVRNVNAELGQLVRAGQTVATIYSDELAKDESDYLSKLAAVNEAEKAYQRSLKLTDIASESQNEIDGAAAEVKIAEAKLAEDKNEFDRMKKLVGIGSVSREAFEVATTDLLTAQARVTESRNRFERAKKLLEINPVRKAEQDASERQLQTARSELVSMRRRLQVLGIPLKRINALKSPEQISAELPIVSPVSGTVTVRKINEGETVMANTELLKVTNLSNVWVIGQVYEKDLASLRIGSGASITTNAYPGEVFRGNVSYIDPNLDQNTRTAQIRIELPNAGERLKIGMYVNLAFASLGESEKTVPVIPKEAVQNINGRQTVFVATTDPKVFLVRNIRTGSESNGMFPVLEGLFVGDKIVTEGSFLLRAELNKTNPSGLR